MTRSQTPAADSHEARYVRERREHWNRVATHGPELRGARRLYHDHLARLYRFLVAPGLRVLEVGCGQGDLLAALAPSYGVGVELSEAMVACARQRHPDLHFVQADAGALPLGGTFDVIIASDLVNDLWDVESVFTSLRGLMDPSSRLIVNAYSRVWELPLQLAQRFGWASPLLLQNWLTLGDVDNLLLLADLEPVKQRQELVMPVPLPVVAPLANQYLARLWPFNQAALISLVVARRRPATPPEPPRHTVSVIIPARNESANIEPAVARTPDMGARTELIFVEGHSTDDTYDAIESARAAHPERVIRLYRQAGTGKGDAVRLGFEKASGDILMILDADLTVPPEDLPRFYEALVTGKGEFINGVRLVYPMEAEAMRFLNLLGNRFFSVAFSWLLGQRIKDSLCGTKVLWKRDYQRLRDNRSYFGDFDPFGDFDLLFGAAKLNLRIVDVPIRYRERTYGTTNIDRWRHGLLLLRMVLFAARRIKFI